MNWEVGPAFLHLGPAGGCRARSLLAGPGPGCATCGASGRQSCTALTGGRCARITFFSPTQGVGERNGPRDTWLHCDSPFPPTPLSPFLPDETQHAAPPVLGSYPFKKPDGAKGGRGSRERKGATSRRPDWPKAQAAAPRLRSAQRRAP